jgi:hypothetical protein
VSLRAIFVLAVVVLTASLAATPAYGQQREQRRVPLTATGALEVVWQGDAARGCARAGVCDVAGRTVLPVDARGEIFSRRSASGGGPGTFFGFLFEDRAGAVTRVERRTGVQPPPVCVDAPGGGGGFGPGGFSLSLSRDREGTATVAVRPGPGLSAGRCAGPLGTDLEDALPTARASAARLLAGSTAVELGGRRPFTAGPFSGEVVSSVRVAVGRPTVRRFGVARRRPRGRRVVTTYRTVALDYRVRALRGAITSPFTGLPEPGCGALDACGLSGATVLAPRAEGDVVRLRARDRRGTRAGTLAGALRDVRAGRLRLGTSFGQPITATVRGEARREGQAQACVDEGGRGALRLMSRTAGDALDFDLRAVQVFPTRAALRSRCPGPGIAPESVVALGSLPLDRVGAAALTLRLDATGADAAPGIEGAPRTGAVVVELRRVRARVSTERRTRFVR